MATTVSLSKGDRISLDQSAGKAVKNVMMGLGWDFSWGRSIDLDASCIMFDAKGSIVEGIYFGQKVSSNGAVRHSGDNLTGAGSGDDETIMVNLAMIPEHVHTLVFTVNSYSGQPFNQVNNAFVRLVDLEGSGGFFGSSKGFEVAHYKLSGGGNHTAMVMAKLYRHNGSWKMNAIGEPAHGRTYRDLLPYIQPYL